MRKCQICQDHIWDDRWPASRASDIKKFVCFYCFGKLKDSKYKPTKPRDVGDFEMCERCGEVTSNFFKIEGEILCEDCRG